MNRTGTQAHATEENSKIEGKKNTDEIYVQTQSGGVRHVSKLEANKPKRNFILHNVCN